MKDGPFRASASSSDDDGLDWAGEEAEEEEWEGKVVFRTAVASAYARTVGKVSERERENRNVMNEGCERSVE